MKHFCFLLLTALALLTSRPAVAQLYDVHPGEVNYDKIGRAALKVQVDGSASEVRDFFQHWMKSSYNVRFRRGGVLGLLQSDVLVARQTPASSISGKLVDLYATVTAPSDSVSEVAVFGGFDDNTFFDPTKTATEYSALRGLVQNFAGAARLQAYRDLVAGAEKQVRATEKEKARLEKERTSLQSSTTANRRRIEELKQKNLDNLTRARADSVTLIGTTQLLEQHRQRLQRRRDRLSALDRKN